MTDETAGELLIQKLTQLQAMFSHLRSYSGPFDPQFPRTVFHLLFCPPLHCSIDPVETFGVIQRIFHSKDGKYLAVSFGKTPRFWRENSTGEDRRAVTILREIREIAREHMIWVTFVDHTGSWFPKYSFMSGMLQPPPGDPVVVPVMEYLERLREFDKTEPPTPGTLLSASIDAHDITRLILNSELVEDMPEQCRACCVDLVARDPNAPEPSVRYMKDTKQCPSCRVIYVREPTDSELTPAEAEQRQLRQAVMAEFMKRIDDEFQECRSKATGAGDSDHDHEDEDPYNLFEGKSWRGDDE